MGRVAKEAEAETGGARGCRHKRLGLLTSRNGQVRGGTGSSSDGSASGSGCQYRHPVGPVEVARRELAGRLGDACRREKGYAASTSRSRVCWAVCNP